MGYLGFRLTKMHYGYFNTYGIDDAPAYDPGLSVPCPVCKETLMALPVVTISIMIPGDDRSFFYRVHKVCYENLSEQAQSDLDGLIVDRPDTLKMLS